ncbi:DUF5813 family protein [Halocalculus aciditolerans]|uniref:Uncharacterized protein n=1 Tax=Halocalculus aciditolerans TaxID=1383812 RepID=A0A830F0W1_9EURY|nr:DUF5813 family protein [Halocalculus aciditolerans]GGL50395.1 hypothetical protein GCM10009039_05680 [Halocalculus aciditolerans]
MSEVTAEFESHGKFAERGEGFEPTTNDWDAVVTVDGGTVTVAVTVPTLDAVVEEDVVAGVVEDGWFETFELRVEDVEGVTYAETGEPTVERDAAEVTVTTTLDARPGNAPDDALAVVNYVEGTWFEGIIPGYDYVEPVQAMRERASQNASETGTQGTPL